MVGLSSFDRVSVIRSDRFDRTFAQEIVAEAGGEHLFTCSACGTCVAACLVPRFDSSFKPRLVLHKARLGLRDEVLSSPEIWQCSACDVCYPRCPKRIHISDVMKAIRSIAIREGYGRPGATAAVDISLCTACGICAAACPYEAISLETVQWNRREKQAAQVDANLCALCGICSAICPSSSISADGYTDLQCHDTLTAAAYGIHDLASTDHQSAVLVIACNWCLRAESDVRALYDLPEGAQVVRVPCSGRVAPAFVMTAFNRGADAVLVIGCKQDECHYRRGSTIAGGRLAMLQSLLELLGVERERVQFMHLGSLDRGQIPRLLNGTIKDLQALGPLTRSNNNGGKNNGK